MEQLLVSLQFQCDEAVVSLPGEPARVTTSAVERRMAEAQAGLPLSQQELAADHRGFLLEHFSLHNFLELEDDCLRACVGGTSTLCLNDMGMLAFTASELRVVQSLRHCGPADQWRRYCRHGPILNEAQPAVLPPAPAVGCPVLLSQGKPCLVCRHGAVPQVRVSACPAILVR